MKAGANPEISMANSLIFYVAGQTFTVYFQFCSGHYNSLK
jgi:hypothetical protein